MVSAASGVPEKTCPSCGAAAPVTALICPLCGHEWFPGVRSETARQPGRKILVALAVALGALAAALLLLYVLAISYQR